LVLAEVASHAIETVFGAPRLPNMNLIQIWFFPIQGMRQVELAIIRAQHEPVQAPVQCIESRLIVYSIDGENMKRSALILLALGSMASSFAFANAELAKSKNCMACHAMDKKMVGPSFKDVAAKYAGQKDAEKQLVQKVIKGGGGVWGSIPMPPNNVTEKEAQSLVKWILAVK
jgi:cytochrome c